MSENPTLVRIRVWMSGGKLISRILLIGPLFFSLFLPVCSTLGLALAVPYIVAYDLVPRIILDNVDVVGDEESDSEEVAVMIQRR